MTFDPSYRQLILKASYPSRVQMSSLTYPGNAEWQRDLSISHERIGDVQRAQGDLPAAVASYRASYGISERL
jgi:hypothetical protein